MNVVVSLVFELLFLSQTAKILSRISLKYFGDAYSFQFGMQLPHGVKKGHITAGWVGACFKENIHKILWGCLLLPVRNAIVNME